MTTTIIEGEPRSADSQGPTEAAATITAADNPTHPAPDRAAASTPGEK